MTALWPSSRTMLVRNRDPIVGAQARFYNAGTSTPQVVYQDAALSTVHDQPIMTNALGLWPAVYLNPTPGSYRVRVVDDDSVQMWDDDDVSVPQAADFVPPDAGETSIELLARVGDLKDHYGTTAPSGWVRAAGRTIGSASSGATERANADCEHLFIHLWNADSTLTVSGGRGANAASDWAANKTIALPDFRDRASVGLGAMGNSDANLIPDSLVDGGENNTTLGATVGAGTHTLTSDQIPGHTHTFTTGNQSQDHTHTLVAHGNSRRGSDGGNVGTNFYGSSGNAQDGGIAQKATGGVSQDHTHSGTTDSTGGGSSHPNVQPSMFVLKLIKL